MKPSTKSFLLILLLGLLALSWRLGSYGLMEPDEGRCASLATSFLRRGEWMVPRLYDRAHFNKPPLLFWTGRVMEQLGGTNEWMARMPAALSGLGVLLLTVAMARRLFGEAAVLPTAWILLPSPLFFTMARIIDPNMLLTLWTTLAFWAALAFRQDGKTWQRLIFYIALGLGCLTKGPVAFAIVGLPLAADRWLPGRVAPRFRLIDPTGLAITLALGLSWFLLVARAHPVLWDFFLGRELYNRVLTTEHHRVEPFWFYGAMILLALLPWLPLLPQTVACIWKRRREAAIRWLLCGLLLPLILFTISKSKMPTYILPLVPLMALLVVEGSVATVSRRMQRVQGVWIAVLALALPAILQWKGHHSFGWTTGWIAVDLLWLLPAALALFWAARTAWPQRLLPLALVLLCAYGCTLGLVERHDGQMASHSSVREMAATLNKEVRPDDRVVLLRMPCRGLEFYLDHPICFPEDKFEIVLESDRERLRDRAYDDVGRVYVWFDQPQRVFLVTTDNALTYLKKVCRKAPREIFRQGRYLVVCNF